jgi:hypothetical protein
VRALGGWGKHIRLRASGISARASTPLDERRRYFAIQKSEAEATPRKQYENEKGGCARADSEGTLNEASKL